jgi:hypothetical protein
MESAGRIYVVGSGNMANMHCLAINSVKKFDLIEKFLVIKDKISFRPPENFKVKNFSTLFHEDISEVFLLVIATGSQFQPHVLETFYNHTIIRNCLLEKNLANSLRDLRKISNIKTNIFVNFPLHFHNEIKYLEHIFDQAIEIEVKSKNHTLMTNSIHYLNLAKRVFASEPSDLKIFPSSDFIDTKRVYAKDIYGEVLVQFKQGGELIIKSNPNLEDDLSIRIKTLQGKKIFVDISRGIIINDNIVKNFPPFQFSMLGHRIYTSMMYANAPFLKLSFSLKLQEKLITELGTLRFGTFFKLDTNVPIA